MFDVPRWITGAARSGKTTRLVSLARAGWQAGVWATAPGEVLVWAANSANRRQLRDQLMTATDGELPLRSTTPMGFFQDEVLLFWPLLVEALGLRGQFPLRLAPETEQELATQLWQPELDVAIAAQAGVKPERLVRRLLDVQQLAALAGLPLTTVPERLTAGLGEPTADLPIPFDTVGDMLARWEAWCLERGLLTYSLVAALYGQHLLPLATYQGHLLERFAGLLADDVDDYPAIARPLCEQLLAAQRPAVFTYNPAGAVRLGLGADPRYLAELAAQCEVETLAGAAVDCLGQDYGERVVQLVLAPSWVLSNLPAALQVMQTVSRAQLLRRIAETIREVVQTEQVAPQDIAVIGPGLDAIARYTLANILAKQDIAVDMVNDQRPLTSSPIIRALLTLLTLIYPGLGRLVDGAAIAEMLVVLSYEPVPNPAMTAGIPLLEPAIDPVRSGLLADHCFVPHPDQPRLLPAKTFPRWDRLGYQASDAYDAIAQWIATQREQLQQRLLPNTVSLLDRAIQHFWLGGGSLPFDQLAALRRLLETAQHYWEVHSRLQREQRPAPPPSLLVSRFIQLLRSGAVTANPFPVPQTGPPRNAVTLATVFQYRASRRAHRWQFWLDAGSPRWLSGIDALFGAPLFQQGWTGAAWTATDALEANEQRLERILRDLLNRTGERVILCHSDLATTGQEQTGPLLTLVNLATPFTDL